MVGNPFAQKPGGAPTPGTGFNFASSGTTAAASPFGLGSTPAPTTPGFAAAPTASLFGSAAPTTAGGFGMSAPAAPSTNIFGQAPATTPAFGLSAPSAPVATSAPAFGTGAMTGPSLFAPAATTGATAAPAAPNSLFTGAKPAAAGGLFGLSTSVSAAPAATSSPFSLGLNTAAPASTGPSLFAPKPAAPSLTTPAFAKPATPSPLSFTTSTSAPAAPAFGLTSGSSAALAPAAATSAPAFALGTTPAATSAPTTTASLTTRPQDCASSKPAVPPTPSALRNKSMDEILHQWSKQLDEQTKAFREQARKVSDWDRKLFANGHQISQLYQMTVETEQTQKTIDQNLDYIDSQQQELSGILDLYEDQVQKMFEKDAASAGVNANGLRPVDEQREQTYSLAENLNKQLDDMSQNLTSMIDEINQTAPKADDESGDPVSQIVQILNAHLTSLQWIDETTTALQTKAQDVGRIQNKIIKEHEGYRSRGVYTGRS
ncbi:FG-nucleoporin nsp1 [Mortierella polycephala]|uniref:Nucleoporin NSP1 n=1 Tax=Mortierella polycephala TaxID=41804 RepID=A0A9P6UAX2_9FUNG|nr:FG-nucleoporin nsp1 [Mortierella polycephala]